jgi:hypothetical protein
MPSHGVGLNGGIFGYRRVCWSPRTRPACGSHATASRTARYLRRCRNMRHCRLGRFELRCAKGPGRWVRRSTKARANSKQYSPRREDYSPGRRNDLHGLRKSDPLRFLKEMNFLSAHRSSNPICPAMESVSAVGFPVLSAMRPGELCWFTTGPDREGPATKPHSPLQRNP